MANINFEKTPAEKKEKMSQFDKSVYLGTLLGGLGGAIQGAKTLRNHIDEAIDTEVLNGTKIFPTIAYDDIAPSLGPTPDKFYDFKWLNPDLPEGQLKSYLNVSQVSPKREIMKDLIEKGLADRPLREKILEKLRYLGKPAAAAAAIGFLTPVVTQFVQELVTTKRDQETTAENVAKAAADYIVGVIEAEMEKAAEDGCIEKIVTDVDIGNIIEEYRR